MKNPPGSFCLDDRHTRGDLFFALYPIPETLYPFLSAFFTASTVSALESDVKFFRSPSFS